MDGCTAMLPIKYFYSLFSDSTTETLFVLITLVNKRLNTTSAQVSQSLCEGLINENLALVQEHSCEGSLRLSLYCNLYEWQGKLLCITTLIRK